MNVFVNKNVTIKCFDSSRKVEKLKISTVFFGVQAVLFCIVRQEVLLIRDFFKSK